MHVRIRKKKISKRKENFLKIMYFFKNLHTKITHEFKRCVTMLSSILVWFQTIVKSAVENELCLGSVGEHGEFCVQPPAETFEGTSATLESGTSRKKRSTLTEEELNQRVAIEVRKCQGTILYSQGQGHLRSLERFLSESKNLL